MGEGRRFFEVVPATREHVFALAGNLRSEDCDELRGVGVGQKRALWRGLRRSVWSSAGLINGEVAAIWGLRLDGLGGRGVPWMLTSPVFATIPPWMAVREGSREIARMQELCPHLENHVAASYAKAIRFLKCLGFTIGPAEATGRDGALYCRFWMGRPYV